MPVRFLRFPYLIVTLSFFAFFVSHSVAKEKSALDELVSLLSASKDIQGEFVQFMVDARGTRVQETRGAFKAKKPNLFYWHTNQPLEQSIYVYKGEITVYDPDFEQASVQPINEDFSATPALLFNGDARAIADQFLVEKRGGAGDEKQFLLFPIEEGSLFEVLRVRFKGNKLSDLRISDSLGQDTTISFIQSYVNSGLTEEDFKPVLPEDVDVIRQSEM